MRAPAGGYAEALAQLSAIAKREALDLGIPRGWEAHLMSDARGDLSALGAERLTLIAETAYQGERYELLHAISRSGLHLGSAATARFLLFRGRSLPQGCWGHRALLFRAAASLARRQGEQRIADSALSEAQGALQYAGIPAGQLEKILTKAISKMTDETIHHLVESEIGEKTYPANPFCDVLERKYREEWGGDNLCDCPHCRAERGEYVESWELEEEDEYFKDDFAEDFELGRPMGSVAGELESIFGLNASSSKADFAKAAKRFAKELGPLPPGFQKVMLPMMMNKLYSTDTMQMLHKLSYDLLGGDGMLAPQEEDVAGYARTNTTTGFVEQYMFTLGPAIAGGATNIQLNIIGERVETVAPWLVDRMLSNRRTGTHIAYMSRPKLIGRFLMAPFRKRNVFEPPGA